MNFCHNFNNASFFFCFCFFDILVIFSENNAWILTRHIEVAGIYVFDVDLNQNLDLVD